jgi:hypothetical protein
MGRRDIHEGIHPSVPFLKETAPVTAGTAPQPIGIKPPSG